MAEEEKQKFNTRPESTIAQNFAADLDSMFGLNAPPGVDNLSRTVEEKKHTVTTGEQQLQELEAKLRETEERLARVSRQNSPSRQANTAVPRTHPESKQAADGAAKPSPLAQKPTYPADRPPTSGDRPPTERADTQEIVRNIPGAMPETPQPQYGGSNEYVMVDRNAGQAQRGYG
ncbi:hypothetical protein M409DRAFT_17770 [Zasmidium cellare ATCC 36951]|uniref:Uncharacterized protein n=1 Tax=Zasmidium cellare ATCC 36951 TaxID=1080233 RepID=A0A6A6D337_ZASCE|nr:uncharacterized protein M409DRAFT_17770 [Zasmidium cellare ATCC 36951]KAF2172539.1 hypothetical protein M409DRAFT_17770 [Zasmidium cellare ATCC 36951]